MIGRVVLFSALMSFAGAASAQEACTFYKVNTSLLNISRDAGGDIYNDALFDGDTACVTRKANVKGADWGFIAYKLGSGNAHTPSASHNNVRLIPHPICGAIATL